MTNSITKKIAAAAIAVSALAGSMALTTTAVVTTTAAVSILTATPASAAGSCLSQTITATGSSAALFKGKQKKRAMRRAARNWKSQANAFGSKFKRFGNAKNQKISCVVVKASIGSETSCTVTGTPCSN